MKSKDLLFWIWLAEALGAGSTGFRILIELYENPYELFHAEESEIERIPKLSERVKAALCDKSLHRATQILECCEQSGIGILAWGDEQYPSTLKDLQNPPVILYWKGKLPDFAQHLSIGMVGTRRMSAYGMRAAYKIGYELATLGVTVVSGMAAGIDGVSGAAALAANGTTVAVLGCGIDVIYPRHHKNLYYEIAKRGLLLSEYPPGTRPNGYHFPVRNRIISGLSQATVVVEAGVGSGALITAKEAILQGRDVFALPANVGSLGAEGTNGLLHDGARLALSASDIIEPYQFLYAQTLRYDRLAKARAHSDADFAYLERMGVIELEHRELEQPSQKAPPTREDTSPAAPKKRREKRQDDVPAQTTPKKTEQESKTPDEIISSLPPIQLAILQSIPDDRAIATDALCALEYPYGEIIGALTMLEIMGLIQKLPGSMYKKS
ncbi:MAG: DNA-processing protein DprA [Clostridia bacterium]|nr:DNA-processing protein DprA [Clostridia bacterium]